jgi:hypothetical protein
MLALLFVTIVLDMLNQNMLDPLGSQPCSLGKAGA